MPYYCKQDIQFYKLMDGLNTLFQNVFDIVDKASLALNPKLSSNEDL